MHGSALDLGNVVVESGLTGIFAANWMHFLKPEDVRSNDLSGLLLPWPSLADLAVGLFVDLSVLVYVCQFLCLSICLSVSLSVCLTDDDL